jgi:hypothetical protein
MIRLRAYVRSHCIVRTHGNDFIGRNCNRLGDCESSIDCKNLAILQNYVGWSDEWRWQRSRRAALRRRMAAGKPAHGRGARSRDELTAFH